MNEPYVSASLAAMIAEAKQKNCMMHCYYQDMWFTPDELAASNAAGRFRWGPVNWEMVSLSDYKARMVRDAENLERNAASLREEISKLP